MTKLCYKTLKKVFLQNKMRLYFFGVKNFQHNIIENFAAKLRTFVQCPTLYIDHSFGGGTELYFKEELNKLSNNQYLLRLQSIQSNFYKLSIHDKGTQTSILLEDLAEVEEILSKLGKINIVVNNLVGYENLSAIFKLITKFKNKTKIMTHDYYSICPSVFLLNGKNEFCDISTMDYCNLCFPKSLIGSPLAKELKTIGDWRKLWSDFYINCVDEIIVFSNSSKDILTKVYPHLESKITIEPHIVPAFKKTWIVPLKKEGPIINIGVLGNLKSTHKGKNIITEMALLIKNMPIKNVKITVIGSYTKKNNITATGEYLREDLPKLLIKHKIDIVFIPSICPETYSYTTSEAIMLDLPVACFNIGAPPERVKLYEKGLIISKINSETALKEIISFVQAYK